MRIIYTEKDVEESGLPTFIFDMIHRLLDVYKTTSMNSYGGIYWLDDQSELALYENKTVELVEIIISGSEKIWHGTFVIDNDYSVDVFVKDCFMTPTLKEEWEDNLIRTVHEDEF